MFVYMVCCDFDDGLHVLAHEWLGWLKSEHLRDVCEAGARNAAIIKLDGAPLSFEIRYEFASRAEFDRYEAEHAPRLRAEGLQRFPLDQGLRYRRSTGVLLAGYPPQA